MAPVHPLLFRIGSFPIYTYGLVAAAGWIVGICWWLRQLPHMAFRGGEREFWRLVYVIVGGAVVGGKILALVAYGGTQDLRELLMSLRGGFVYLGGVVGSGLCAFVYVKLKGYVFFEKADFFAAGLALGHALGRLGCLAAGCCHGSPTSLPWGITYTDPLAAVFPREWLGTPLHPTQILETVGELAIFAALHFGLQPRRIAGRLAPGLVTMAYFLLYGVLRLSVDFLRGDDPDFRIGPLTASQGISLVLIAVALLYGRRLARRAAKPRRAGQTR